MSEELDASCKSERKKFLSLIQQTPGTYPLVSRIHCFLHGYQHAPTTVQYGGEIFAYSSYN